VSDRDVCVYGYGADLLEDGIVMAVVRSHNVSPVIDKDYKTKEPKSGTKSDKQSSKKQQHPQHHNQMSSRPNDPPLEHCSIYDLLDEETKAKIPPETSKLVRVDVRIGGYAESLTLSDAMLFIAFRHTHQSKCFSIADFY
jgi:hypothetical protein